MPKRIHLPHLVNIWLLLFTAFALISCAERGEIYPTREIHQTAIYFEPTASEAIIDHSELNKENIYIVRSYSDLQNTFEDREGIKILYIHPDAVEIVEDKWLRDQFRSGVAIVAINTPISILSTKLGVRASMDDLEKPTNGTILISFYQQLDSQAGSGLRVISDYFHSFHLASAAVYSLATH